MASWADESEAWRTWSPLAPGHMMRFERAGQLEWVGFITESVVMDERVQVRGQDISVVFEDYPLPYPPPGARWFISPDAAEYWWRQLHYLFQLPDPSTFPSVIDVLDDADLAEVRRYINVVRRLAGSVVMSHATEAVLTNPMEPKADARYEKNMPAPDALAGFSAFLRQCYSDSDQASFSRVRNILSRAASAAHLEDELVGVLRQWKQAVRRAGQRSFNDLLSDTFTAREGWATIPSRKAHGSPADLLKTFWYGDQIHWGSGADDIIDEADDATESVHQQMEFLDAAACLAHLYIGFGQLAVGAISRPGELVLP